MEVLHEPTCSASAPYQRTVTATTPAGAAPTTSPLDPVSGSRLAPLRSPAAAHAGIAAQLGNGTALNLS